MNHKKILFIVAFIGIFLTASGFQTSPEYKILFEKAKFTMETKGDLNGAINLFNDIIKKYPKEREYAAKSQLYIGLCYEKQGVTEARKAYERVVKEYSDQSDIVNQAKGRLAALGGSSSHEGLVARRVLTDASSVYGVLTTDGKYISHIDEKTGDIVQFEVASGQTSRIINKVGAAAIETPYEFLAFTREGKQIVYDWNPKDSATPASQLRIRNLDGSGLRTFYSEKGSYVRPFDLSPDAGSVLALRGSKKAVELTLISTADGSVRVLRNISRGLFWTLRASFSPDGRFIVFGIVREGSPPHGEICLMTADGRNEVVIAGHPAEDQLLRWTPDGRSLIFLSDRSGTWDIWTVHITEGKQQGEPELLKRDFGYYSEVLGFTPDGSFYYKTNTTSGGLYSGEVDLETGKVLVPPTLVATRYTGAPDQPTWSPDGSNLLYLSQRGVIGPGNNILTIRSAATGKERFLSPSLRFVNWISWAPDGCSIVAFGLTPVGLTPEPINGRGIFRIDTETSEITWLADLGFAPNLCPDGKTLVFYKNDLSIWKRNTDTGEESKVVKVDSEGANYDLSPDGREVVFQVDNVLKTVSLNGGEPRVLFDGLVKASYNLRWTRDSRYIIASKGNSVSSEIWRVPVQGGTPLKMDLSVPKMGSFTLNRDNRHFAFSVYEGTREELWVMENFMPK